ncbi:MAG: DUF2973 domain-containing protein [Gloeomargarita sp. SKYBB_i_bin120]|nr:DUF2973 domain-containing protein [Gloeomargarita sp. SKYG98]MCS7291501.1 DUF2973 domain-containing protein [Gloeomargarita sp. SKYB120]MDW8177061.1 DUF2973 domain-containing protein [Gloeomargarita sp. SKYBB_i_bin120]
MFLHLLYVVLFTVLAVLALGNLIGSLIRVSLESQYPRRRSAPHPELLDADGNPIEEPLLVVRSVNLEEARQQLDRLYDEEES